MNPNATSWTPEAMFAPMAPQPEPEPFYEEVLDSSDDLSGWNQKVSSLNDNEPRFRGAGWINTGGESPLPDTYESPSPYEHANQGHQQRMMPTQKRGGEWISDGSVGYHVSQHQNGNGLSSGMAHMRLDAGPPASSPYPPSPSFPSASSSYHPPPTRQKKLPDLTTLLKNEVIFLRSKFRNHHFETFLPDQFNMVHLQMANEISIFKRKFVYMISCDYFPPSSSEPLRIQIWVPDDYPQSTPSVLVQKDKIVNIDGVEWSIQLEINKRSLMYQGRSERIISGLMRWIDVNVPHMLNGTYLSALKNRPFIASSPAFIDLGRSTPKAALSPCIALFGEERVMSDQVQMDPPPSSAPPAKSSVSFPDPSPAPPPSRGGPDAGHSILLEDFIVIKGKKKRNRKKKGKAQHDVRDMMTPAGTQSHSHQPLRHDLLYEEEEPRGHVMMIKNPNRPEEELQTRCVEEEEEAECDDEEEGAKGNTVSSKGNIKLSVTGLEFMNLGVMSYTGSGIVVNCLRCRTTEELKGLQNGVATGAYCRQCRYYLSATVTSEIIHQHSTTIGYLSTEGCNPLELIHINFQSECENCFERINFKNVQPPTERVTRCHECHKAANLKVGGILFEKVVVQATTLSNRRMKHTVEDEGLGLRPGRPLQDNGACTHYKQSNRWLRFPCCGRAFPCDSCHDSGVSDGHQAEWANKMICGYCSKEQGVQNECRSCGQSLGTKGKRTHWEGGAGCRDQSVMCKNDRQKYTGKNKTVANPKGKPKNKTTDKNK